MSYNLPKLEWRKYESMKNYVLPPLYLFGQGIYKCMFALPRNLVVCFYAELVRAGAGTGTSSFIMLFGKG